MYCWFSGISINPSALVKVVIAPDASVMGSAIKRSFSMSSASLTVIKVRLPFAENSFAPANALIVRVSCGALPHRWKIVGRTSIWNINRAAAGLPGRENMGLFCMKAMVVGFPGLTAMPEMTTPGLPRESTICGV